MGMNVRLVLHAGTHKTGTTSIQKALASNRAIDRARGLFYPDRLGRFDGHKGATTVPHHLFAHGLTGFDPILLRESRGFADALRQEAGVGETVVISTEALYRHRQGHLGIRDFSTDLAGYWPARNAYLADVASTLHGFDVDVVLYFRKRADFARSLAAEFTSKGSWTGNAKQLATAFAPLLDYERQVEAFRRAFGKVTIVDYDHALTEGGSVEVFYRTIGFTPPADAATIWERRSADRDGPLRRLFGLFKQETSGRR